MSMICKILCCCCYYLCDSTPPSEDSSPLLHPNDHSLNTPKGQKVDNPVTQPKEISIGGYHSFSSPPRKPMSSRSITPDSAYGDGETYQGTVTKSSPEKSTYGIATAQDYV